MASAKMATDRQADGQAGMQTCRQLYIGKQSGRQTGTHACDLCTTLRVPQAILAQARSHLDFIMKRECVFPDRPGQKWSAKAAPSRASASQNGVPNTPITPRHPRGYRPLSSPATSLAPGEAVGIYLKEADITYIYIHIYIILRWYKQRKTRVCTIRGYN